MKTVDLLFQIWLFYALALIFFGVMFMATELGIFMKLAVMNLAFAFITWVGIVFEECVDGE